MGRLNTGWAGVAALAGALVALACRERAAAARSQTELRQLVQGMVPAVERATGLKFKRNPAVELRTREQVRAYVIHKLDSELTPAELAGYQAALRLFGLIPDTLELRRTIINVLYEQVAGYYDPDSNALYIAADLDPFRARVTMSHELVHALQDQYLNLDSIMKLRRQNDRRTAAMAILEGQATLAQIPVMMPEQRPDTLPEGWFWRQREVMAAQQDRMQEFASAPLWLRDGLVFPYLAGADFVNWYQRTHGRASPFGAAMPRSTEQILHPERYTAGDAPTDLAFGAPRELRPRYEDGLGEFETRLLLVQHTGVEGRGEVLAAGWDGDRYAVFGEAAAALVWYTVWDDAAAADRFARGLQAAWAQRRAVGPPGRRSRVERLDVEGRPAVRLVDAPAEWAGWGAIPMVRVTRSRD